MQFISKIILKAWGWKVKGQVPANEKFLIVSAPHTSNLDFIMGRLVLGMFGIQPRVMIKKELFFFPLGNILRALGGIPVDRKASSHIVDQMVEHFQQNERFVLVITPEGTRSRVKSWKKGFYYIATRAKVPVVPGGFDYKDKIVHIGEPYFLSGNEEEEMQRIKHYAKGIHPRHPEKFTVGELS